MNLPRYWWLPIGKVPEVSPQELAAWLENGTPLQVVDARTSPEHLQGTIGNAWHAPVTGMPTSMETLPLDPALPVVVLCLTGHRSIPGTRWLRARGCQAYSLRGGVTAWKMAGYPLQKPT